MQYIIQKMATVPTRGGLTTHGPPGNRGSWGPCVLAQTQKSFFEFGQGHKGPMIPYCPGAP
ncbi:unnamed protein product [Staurois parvus]|uniref:Uncharacterized protein n=1 Tax=Staurois parvus TaxID=386267 RepID=A0ABN9ATC3_9NEOB|nr:unnamed protein product [Staurois parvus]